MISFGEILKLDDTAKRINNPVIIYGTGKVAKIFYKYCRNNKWDILAICDSNQAKIGTTFFDKIVTDFDSVILENNDFCVVIATGANSFYEIKANLLKKINKSKLVFEECPFNNTQREEFVNLIHESGERLNLLHEKLNDEKSKDVMIQVLKGNVSENNQFFVDAFTLGQYFNELTDSAEEDYFVDAGAYIGDTLEVFVNRTRGKFKKVYSFEPFKACYDELVRNSSKYDDLKDKIELFNMGLFSRNGVISFDNTLPDGSHKIDGGESMENMFQITTLDELNLEKVTFIKMDIEGSELEALKGAKKTIEKFKPKLAICVYHNATDILELSDYIESLNLNYKYYLRHHNDNASNDLCYCETVLYAI